MKSLTVLPLLLIRLAAFSQQIVTPSLPIDSTTRLITYSEVVKLDTSLKKIELFSRAREWFAKNYNSSNNVIQMEDKESGKIVGKALMRVYHKALGSDHPSSHINYTISIYLKDGRFKYEIANFYHTGDGNKMPDYGSCEEMINTKKKYLGISYQKTFTYYLLQLDANTRSLIVSLKASMNGKPIGKKKDDW
jgi:hypothetical protein